MKTYLAWGTCALFFFYQYILRVSPGVMVTDLRHDFQMTAEQFASMGAVYLYAYSLLQIPLGIIIDRVGVRKTVMASIVLCIAGTAMLGVSNSVFYLQLSRLLIGAGSACGFMSSLKVAADYLPAGKRGLLIGATLTLGTVGALTAGKPLVALVEKDGWRYAVWTTAELGILILVLAFLFLRLPPKGDKTAEVQRYTLKQIVTVIGQIVRNRPVMLYAILAVGLYTPLSVLADLWGTAFLMQKYSLNRADAAQTTMLMYAGLAVGSLVLPWACEKFNLLDRVIQICGIALLVCFAFLLFGPAMSLPVLSILLVILGLFCGAEMVCFTGALQHTSPANSGMTIGVVNTLNMLGGAILQQLIGFLLDLRWAGALDADGVRQYTTPDYLTALSVLLVVLLACAFIAFRTVKRP